MLFLLLMLFELTLLQGTPRDIPLPPSPEPSVRIDERLDRHP